MIVQEVLSALSPLRLFGQHFAIVSEFRHETCLGRGNMAPRREVERPKRAPMVTTVPTKFHPTAWKACGRGESGSCR